MINWKYNPENYGKIKPVTPGQYRVRIEKAEEAVSSTGKDMIKMTLKVSGHNQIIFENIVFPIEPASKTGKEYEEYIRQVEFTDNKLGRIFDSFNIEPGNMNIFTWRGKVGAAEIKNEVDNQGNMQSRIKFFLKRKEQDSLPAWQEGATKNTVNPNMVDVDDGLAPF